MHKEKEIMDSIKKTPKQPASSTLKILRALSIALLAASVAYIIMPYDFDNMGWKGYVDDFFVFMAAFTFLNGAFQRPERLFMRRQFYVIALVFFIMGMLWVSVLDLMA